VRGIVMTRIEGVPANHQVVGDACRLGRGDVGAIDRVIEG